MPPPTHVLKTRTQRPQTLSLPLYNGEREALPEGMRRGSSATELSAGQNSNLSAHHQQWGHVPVQSPCMGHLPADCWEFSSCLPMYPCASSRDRIKSPSLGCHTHRQFLELRWEHVYSVFPDALTPANFVNSNSSKCSY